MGTGSLIEAEDQISKAAYNHKFNLIETAAVIEAIAVPPDGMSVVPTTTGSILKKHRHYIRDAGLGIWLDQSNPPHTHADNDTGGPYSDIRIGADKTFWGIDETDLIFQPSNGSPTYANIITGTDGYRSISTGATTNNAGNLVAAGLRYDMAFKLYAQFRALMSTVTTSYTTRAGFNMEFAHISSNASRKLGIEACNTCNGTNIRVVSADGSVRSASNTTDLASDTAVYKLVFNPNTPSLTYTRNNGTAVVKTSNMPTTGVPDRSNVFVTGIQTLNTTSKELRLTGLRSYGTISLESGVWS